MKTLVRIAVALERIANALDRITGSAVYVAPPVQAPLPARPLHDPFRCVYCGQHHPAGLPCPSVTIT